MSGTETNETPAGGAGGATGEQPPGTTQSTTARGSSTGQLINNPPPAGGSTSSSTTTTPPAGKTDVARDAHGNRISGDGLVERLKRERAAADKKWAEALGFKTVEEAKAFVDKGRELEAKEKEKKLSEMSEIDRLKAQLADKDTEIAQLRTEHDQAQTSVLVERQDRITRDIAVQYVKPRSINFAVYEFKTYLKGLTEAEVEKLTEKDLRKFFVELVKENPEHGREAGTTTTKEEPKTPTTPERRRISTGGPPAKKRDGERAGGGNNGANANGKTVLPGQKNSMNAAEVRAFAASKGIDYPGPGMSARNRQR